MSEELFVSFGIPIDDDNLRLYHGTDVDSANSIIEQGLSLEAMTLATGGAYVSDAFFASIAWGIAKQYADLTQSNPTRGPGTILGFDVPVDAMRELLKKNPPVVGEDVFDKAYVFYQQSFSTMNSVMTNFTVELLTSDE